MMKRRISLLLNLFITIASFAAWIHMIITASAGDTLAASGLVNLKFFTILSNLFNGIVCFACTLQLLRSQKLSLRMRTWNLLSTSAVGLTFTVVMTFLGPVFGYQTMFNDSNLWFHLILPAASMLGFILLGDGSQLPFRSTLYAALPTVLYAAGYLINIAVQGIGEWPNRHDFYGFLLWGWGPGMLIACAIVLVTWLLAVLLRKLSSMTGCVKLSLHPHGSE